MIFSFNFLSFFKISMSKKQIPQKIKKNANQLLNFF